MPRCLFHLSPGWAIETRGQMRAVFTDAFPIQIYDRNKCAPTCSNRMKPLNRLLFIHVGYEVSVWIGSQMPSEDAMAPEAEAA
jgi:hypothetical protein